MGGGRDSSCISPFGRSSRVEQGSKSRALSAENRMAPVGGHSIFWRRERDSNPRRAINPYSLSRGALSTTQPSLRTSCVFESNARSALTRAIPGARPVGAFGVQNRSQRFCDSGHPAPRPSGALRASKIAPGDFVTRGILPLALRAAPPSKSAVLPICRPLSHLSIHIVNLSRPRTGRTYYSDTRLR